MKNTVKDKSIGRREHLVRMERNYEVIQGLSLKLSSYTCEPRCASQFERYIELKQSFRRFEEHQKQLSAMIQEGRGFSGTLEREVQLHFDRYRQLESDVAGYLLELGDNP